MLGRALAWVAAVSSGVVLGAASAWAALEFGRSMFSEQYGGWSHNRAAGSQAAGPYTRAIIAREGLLALSAREALYFSLEQDARGHPLSEGCVYELDSPPLDARWWSLTLYAGDNFLAQNEDNAPSIDASRALTDAGGGWRARISPVRGEAANWVSSRNAGRGFVLTLRVYNPRRDFHADAETLPVLTTISCAEGAP
jgi:hypothetical protein